MNTFKSSAWADAREKRRLQAIFLYRSGLKQKDIAKKIGVTESAVSQWIKSVRENGIAAIKSKEKIKKKSKLTDEQKLLLIKHFKSLPTDNSAALGSLTLKSVSEHIYKEFGVIYSPNYISRLLKSIGIFVKFNK